MTPDSNAATPATSRDTRGPAKPAMTLYVVRSLSEDRDAPHGAFWSNSLGWTCLAGADHFTTRERMQLHLPMAAGLDAEWMLLEEAQHLVRQAQQLLTA